MSEPNDVTRLLIEWRDGSKAALDELMPLVYDDLKRVAANRVIRDGSLGATAVVHDVYARLVGSQVGWQDRAHFFAIAANMVRNILVDHARAKGRQKRGDNAVPMTLHEDAHTGNESAEDLLALDRALSELQALDERKVKLIELCYFTGLNQTEAAEALGVSVATVERDLKLARAYLNQKLEANR
ncbi:MAG: ECF-type sigma factor [Pseudomonadota bacterium]